MGVGDYHLGQDREQRRLPQSERQLVGGEPIEGQRAEVAADIVRLGGRCINAARCGGLGKPVPCEAADPVDEATFFPSFAGERGARVRR